MLGFISGISLGVLLGVILSLWYIRDYNKEILISHNELTKYLMVKQDASAFATIFPKPDIDKLKIEEEQKKHKDISEYNSMMLRDSVNQGYTEDEIQRFGLDNEGITA